MGAIMAELFTLRPLFPGSRYHILFLSNSTASQTNTFFYLHKGNKYLINRELTNLWHLSLLLNKLPCSNIWLQLFFTIIWLISLQHSICQMESWSIKAYSIVTGLEINLFHYGCICSEADEIYKICSVIGSPTTESWADGLKLARDINYQFPQVSFLNLDLLIK